MAAAAGVTITPCRKPGPPPHLSSSSSSFATPATNPAANTRGSAARGRGGGGAGPQRRHSDGAWRLAHWAASSGGGRSGACGRVDVAVASVVGVGAAGVRAVADAAGAELRNVLREAALREEVAASEARLTASMTHAIASAIAAIPPPPPPPPQLTLPPKAVPPPPPPPLPQQQLSRQAVDAILAAVAALSSRVDSLAARAVTAPQLLPAVEDDHALRPLPLHLQLPLADVPDESPAAVMHASAVTHTAPPWSQSHAQVVGWQTPAMPPSATPVSLAASAATPARGGTLLRASATARTPAPPPPPPRTPAPAAPRTPVAPRTPARATATAAGGGGGGDEWALATAAARPPASASAPRYGTRVPPPPRSDLRVVRRAGEAVALALSPLTETEPSGGAGSIMAAQRSAMVAAAIASAAYTPARPRTATSVAGGSARRPTTPAAIAAPPLSALPFDTSIGTFTAPTVPLAVAPSGGGGGGGGGRGGGAVPLAQLMRRPAAVRVPPPPSGGAGGWGAVTLHARAVTQGGEPLVPLPPQGAACDSGSMVATDDVMAAPPPAAPPVAPRGGSALKPKRSSGGGGGGGGAAPVPAALRHAPPPGAPLAVAGPGPAATPSGRWGASPTAALAPPWVLAEWAVEPEGASWPGIASGRPGGGSGGGGGALPVSSHASKAADAFLAFALGPDDAADGGGGGDNGGGGGGGGRGEGSLAAAAALAGLDGGGGGGGGGGGWGGEGDAAQGGDDALTPSPRPALQLQLPLA